MIECQGQYVEEPYFHAEAVAKITEGSLLRSAFRYLVTNTMMQISSCVGV